MLVICGAVMSRDIRSQMNEYFGKINVENIVIIDWCSGRKKAQNHIRHKNCKIITVDLLPQRTPTIVADACIPIVIEEADMAFLTEALEHCKDDDAVLDNVYNNLKKGGIVIVSVPFKCKKHGWVDYRRYNREQIVSLLEKHKFKVLEELELVQEDVDRVGFLLKVQK